MSRQKLRVLLSAIVITVVTPFAHASDGQGDAKFNSEDYEGNNTALSREDEILLNKFMGAFENEISQRAKDQGELVGRLTQVFVDVLVSSATNRIRTTVDSPEVLSATSPGQAIGRWAGQLWQDHAEEKIRAAQRKDAIQKLPAAKEQIARAQERRQEQELRSKRIQEANERREKLVGPPRPNAFY